MVILVDHLLLGAILDPKEPLTKETNMFKVDYHKVWKDLNASKSIQSYHIIQLAILKAIDKYKDDPAVVPKARNYIYHKMAVAFTPVRRQTKLDNGRRPFDTAIRALNVIPYVTLFFKDAETVLTSEGVKLYRDIVRQLDMHGFIEYYNREYVYIFVRQDISPEYQAVQAAHATLKAGWHYRNGADMSEDRMNRLYFTLVGVPSLSALEDIVHEYKIAIPFFEPDLNGQMTAVVLRPRLAWKRGKLLTYDKLVFAK